MDMTRSQKLKMWKKQQVELEKQLSEAMVKKGEAAQLGDLSENAQFKDAVEQTEMLSARLAGVQRMIKELEKPASVKALAGKGR